MNYKKKNKDKKTKDALLLEYKKLYTIYELLKHADLLNNKIFIEKKWELIDYFQYIGVSKPLHILHNLNLKTNSLLSSNYLLSKFQIKHHSQYNFMRQEQTIIRKKINTDYNLSYESDLFSIYYYIKRFIYNNKNIIETTLINKKKKKTLIDITSQKYIINRLYYKIIEKLDELLL